jgi:hypothetical protein
MPRRLKNRRIGATISKSERLSLLERIEAGYSPKRLTRDAQMKGILIAVAATALGTLAYITIGIALASVS